MNLFAIAVSFNALDTLEAVKTIDALEAVQTIMGLFATNLAIKFSEEVVLSGATTSVQEIFAVSGAGIVVISDRVVIASSGTISNRRRQANVGNGGLSSSFCKVNQFNYTIVLEQ